MSVLRHQIRRGAYADSIVLMQLQSSLAALPEVEDAGVVMATRANLDLLRANGLLPSAGDLDVGADDMLLVVRAGSAAAADAALGEVDRLLERRRPAAGDEEFRPRSLRGALRLAPAAGWVLVSVPGRWAARVARQALEADRHVFLYSDNVALADEVALKRLGRERRRLVMGPDCGTASVAGIGLGFANRVRRGPIGLVAAAGTGLQAVASGIHERGAGVSHAIGTGGRDLAAEVGGATTLAALATLAADPETAVVVLVSKPPSPAVAARVLTAARAIGKPVVVCFLGLATPLERSGRLLFARSLGEAAELAVEVAAEPATAAATDGHAEESTAEPGEAAAAAGCLRGLFSGGTLALEVLQGLLPVLSPLSSNLALPGVEPLADPAASHGHAVLDLGGDEFTVGRLHPMIDPDLRRRRLEREASDPDTGVILLDFVLGEGAHEDPAASLAPAIRHALAARGAGLEVVALVVGTDRDPQDLERQVATLEEAGATVVRDPRQAVARVVDRLAPGGDGEAQRAGLSAAVPLDAFTAPLSAINVGLEAFHSSLIDQGAASIHVDWRPPAGGDEKLLALLDRMNVRTKG